MALRPLASNIHNTAIVHPSAVLGDGVSIGPNSIVGANVRIGDSTEIGANALIEPGVTIGGNCRIFHGAAIGGPPQISNFKDVPSSVEIGDGCVIREYVTIHRGGKENGVTRLGKNCMFMAYSHAGHDCEVGDNATVVNCTGLAGHVTVGEHAFISGYVGVHQFARVGKHAMVAGGMIVRQDVLPYSLVGGPPPRLVGLNSVGLRRRGFSPEVRAALKRAFKLLRRAELNTAQAVEKIESEIEMAEEIGYLVQFINDSSRGITKGITKGNSNHESD
ncbi:MAG: acyl-ACP--UDP-N-acetylglucosamine O-acyltransferase [Nitrospinae bacterium]|nr:acyl-ACP--UDP-N-acetylglucosamine O-acyltransferase [Nitrospinota bacterium]